MCGIIGIYSHENVYWKIYYALLNLQHRGQDASGIVTYADNQFYANHCKGTLNGLNNESSGNVGIGHVRYSTVRTGVVQPIIDNQMSLAFNGHLHNIDQFNTESDVFVFTKLIREGGVEEVYRRCRGGFAVVFIKNGELIAFRDPYGIRPLVLGKSGDDYAVASESVAFDMIGFDLLRDVKPGEMIRIGDHGLVSEQLIEPLWKPCLFEYFYFARPDSIMNGVRISTVRENMGRKLAKHVQHLDIDCVIPVPNSSRYCAIQLAKELNIPYEEGFFKNDYIGRTFISQKGQRKKLVKLKLNPIKEKFNGKRVLIIDDSIVRGNTGMRIIQMARDAGAEKVYFASCSPEVMYQNYYGIDIPTQEELIAWTGKDMGADQVIYQHLDDLKEAIRMENSLISDFEDSVFTGNYIV